MKLMRIASRIITGIAVLVLLCVAMPILGAFLGVAILLFSIIALVCLLLGMPFPTVTIRRKRQY